MNGHVNMATDRKPDHGFEDSVAQALERVLKRRSVLQLRMANAHTYAHIYTCIYSHKHASQSTSARTHQRIFEFTLQKPSPRGNFSAGSRCCVLWVHHNSHAKRPRKQHSTHPSSTKGQNGRTTAIKNTPCACGNISLDCVLCAHLCYSFTHVWPQQQLDLPEQLERVRGTVQNI